MTEIGRDCHAAMRLAMTRISMDTPVGAIIDRPGILFAKCRAAGTNMGYFPSGNPKMFHFRRASNARPYIHSNNTN